MPNGPFPRTIKGVQYETHQQYLNTLAQSHGFQSRAKWRAAPIKVQDTASLTRQQSASYRSALRAVNLMREKKLSLNQAAQQERVDPNTVKRYAGSALSKSGRSVVAKEYDRLPRTLRMLNAHGQFSITVKDSRTAKLIGSYWDAVDQYKATGDSKYLKPFQNKTFRLNKVAYRFVTDPKILDQLYDAGELHFDDLYDNGNHR